MESMTDMVVVIGSVGLLGNFVICSCTIWVIFGATVTVVVAAAGPPTHVASVAAD